MNEKEKIDNIIKYYTDLKNKLDTISQPLDTFDKIEKAVSDKLDVFDINKVKKVYNSINSSVEVIDKLKEEYNQAVNKVNNDILDLSNNLKIDYNFNSNNLEYAENNYSSNFKDDFNNMFDTYKNEVVDFKKEYNNIFSNFKDELDETSSFFHKFSGWDNLSHLRDKFMNTIHESIELLYRNKKLSETDVFDLDTSYFPNLSQLSIGDYYVTISGWIKISRDYFTIKFLSTEDEVISLGFFSDFKQKHNKFYTLLLKETHSSELDLALDKSRDSHIKYKLSISYLNGLKVFNISK